MSEDATKKSAYRLLAILQEYAPNGEAQEKAAEFYRDAQSDGLSQRELTIRMANAIVDGLAFGNWPWTKYSTKRK